MPTLTRHPTALLSAAVLALACSHAHGAAITLSLEPVSSTVRTQFPLAIDVYLRNYSGPSGLQLGGVDLDFGGITAGDGPLRFRTMAEAPDGFEPDAALAANLSDALDASLVDGYAPGFGDLSFVTDFDATAGLPLDGGDVRLGRLFLLATESGDYSLSAAFEGTLVHDFDGEPLDLTFAPAGFTAFGQVIPEPGGPLGLMATALLATRRTKRTT